MQIQARIEGLLRDADRNAAWLAQESGLQRSTITRILNNERMPTASTLSRIAPVFGLTLADLVAGTDAAHLAEKATHLSARNALEVSLRQKQADAQYVIEMLRLSKSDIATTIRTLDRVRVQLLGLQSRVDEALNKLAVKE